MAIAEKPTDDIIQVDGLQKHFGDVKAVNGITFRVRHGEVFGLLGPNGAGKTTTIKTLLGLLEPTAGIVRVFGLDPLKDEVLVKQRLGYVAEEPLIYKSLTPVEVFDFIASVRELDGVEVSTKAREYMESLGATEYANRSVATLSRGNRQKVQIVSALLHDPALLIMDDPLLGLDAKTVKVVKEIIDLHTRRGGAVIFSTHIMEVAQELCDRIAIINNGVIVGMGTFDELRKQADKAGANLEDVFLRLTEQDASVSSIIAKLRESFEQRERRE
ncbi:MAG: ABC transporter ATP-binding protein [Candidatus Lokiarchaeota archaeon]|nr:ABC transporter ATP-binding protein [Candidatus Lokiarchaeota archaeon]